MHPAKAFLRASLGLGSFLRPPVVEAHARGRAAAPAPVMVPIRTIGPRERGRIGRHLLALTPHDRYLRFGYAATDEQIGRYVADLDFERDDIFGIYNRKLELIAVAHLAFSADPKASNAPSSACRSCARRAAAATAHACSSARSIHARNEGVDLLFIHALSENTAMLKIARKRRSDPGTLRLARPRRTCACRRPRSTAA
jgi:hypothetical protein